MIRSAAAISAILSLTTPILAAQARDAKAPPLKSKLDPRAVRCVKTPIIGSLAQFQRTCMTNQEWDRTRAEVERLRNPSSCPSGQCGGG